MRKSFFTVDFQSKETKTESSRPGLRPGVSVCQKGCEAPRASTPRSGSAVRSPRRKAGQAAKRVRSTEGEHAAQRQRSPKPATQSGAGRQKGCEAPRASTPRSGSAVRSLRREAGQAAKRVRSTEDEDGPERATAVRSPRRKAGRAAKKGAKHRGRARRAAAAQSEACDAKRGGPPKRVRSTEDEDSPERATAVRSPRRKAGRAAKKGAKHRGRARRAAAAQSEACDAKRGRPPKRVRSTEGEHAAQRQRSPKPATRSGAGRKKGAKPVTRRGTGCRRAFYIHFP